MENIKIDELHNLLDGMNDKHLILDVRSPEEFNEGHIKGAQNTPHDQVGTIVDELKEFETVYVHCKMGGRAKMASQTLSDAGLENIVCVGDGGMQRWRDMGWDIES